MDSANTKGVSNNRLYTYVKRGDFNHNSLKKSAVIATLRKRGDTPEKIAAKTDICIAQVYNHLKINGLPENIRDYIREGRIPATDVLQLKRNQPTDKAFIKEVERYIRMKEKSVLPMDSNITKKEQSFAKKGVATEKQHKFITELENLLGKYSPFKVTKQKINLAAGILNQVISS